MIITMNKIALSSLLVLSLTVSSSAFQCPSRTNYQVRNTIQLQLQLQLHGAASNDEDFDPLLSPHAYPKGTDKSTTAKAKATEKEEEDEEDWSPFKMQSVKNDFDGASSQEYGVEKSTFTRQWSASTVSNSEEVGPQETPDSTPTEKKDAVEFFDPLLSPHSYPQGTKAGPAKAANKRRSSPSSSLIQKQTVGVLLIDHGSKRPTSNQRLEQLRVIYQERSPAHYSVKAAHMEIAEPSIQDMIREFCQEGVGKIVCHPYFLSPGRHVLEDIPVLIEEAVVAMREEGVVGLEVLTTDPVGSNLDLMVGLIGSMVNEALGEGEGENGEGEGYESGFVEEKSGSLGGFFGEVQRMLDEQL